MYVNVSDKRKSDRGGVTATYYLPKTHSTFLRMFIRSLFYMAETTTRVRSLSLLFFVFAVVISC